MPTLDNQEMMRAIIMDHYQYPHNKELVDDSRYHKVHMDSESCIDDIYVQALIQNDVLLDIRFDGVACAIATSSTSIMTDLLKDKTITDAKLIIENYYKMIREESYDSEILEEAIVFKNTGKQANRIKCATIGWNAIEEIIKKVSDGTI